MKNIRRLSLWVVMISVPVWIGYYYHHYYYYLGTTLKPTAFVFRTILADILQSAANALMIPPPPSSSSKHHALLLQSLYWKTTILQALTHHNLMDAVDGKTDCRSIATSKGLDVDFTCRFLRAGTSIGLLTTTTTTTTTASKTSKQHHVYQLTATGALLQRNHPDTVADLYDMMNSNLFRESLHAVATKSIKSGRSGVREAFGMEIFDYFLDHPQEGEVFDLAMNQISSKIAKALVRDWTPPTPNATVCDIGGGKGTIIAALCQQHPGLKGILFDLPDTVKRAQTYIETSGLSNRIDIVAGDFFSKFPKELSSCDVFYLKAIFHDWGDDACVTIIQNIKEIAQPGAKIVGHDIVLGIGDAENTKIESDVTMMAMCSGGRERTKDEYFALFQTAGITAPPRLIKLHDLSSVVEVDL